MERGLLEGSVHDQRLRALTHPHDHENPKPLPKYDLVVIGGGTAGLVSAIGAGVLGARVALVERGLLGGDCLNFGCVPSKALIAAARAAHGARTASRFGVHIRGSVDVDFAEVMEQLREARATVAPHDAVTQVQGFGVHVFLGAACFVARDTLTVGDARLRFRRAIVATGGRPSVPSIPGLEDSGFLTSETVFALTKRPRHLFVIGGGPIGCELAQAFRRLGSEVTVLQRSKSLLPREDDDVARLLHGGLEAEGVRVVLGADIARVERRRGSDVCTVTLASGESIDGDTLLVATGRAPNVEALGLDLAGVDADANGIVVDDRLRTTNSHVFAAGDVASRYKFTHAADALARVALENALFFGRKKASALVVPWCTYSDPEIAHVGLTSAEASRVAGASTLTLALDDVDRAITDRDTRGLARVHVDRRGRVLGATLVSRNAGEMLAPIVIAMRHRLRLADLGRAIVPYPTRSEVWKRLADEHARARLTPRVLRWLERYFRLFR
jgi:pyruvate/2-oxoglutarate dehydrogenase complex dihydrolipoamide dehydrogenase (E3) component